MNKQRSCSPLTLVVGRRLQERRQRRVGVLRAPSAKCVDKMMRCAQARGSTSRARTCRRELKARMDERSKKIGRGLGALSRRCDRAPTDKWSADVLQVLRHRRLDGRRSASAARCCRRIAAEARRPSEMQVDA